ncbi:SDR family oxidoreductase [Nakamurella silvestris]|nr:SDR family oxidoreductase [Nakamurella silvestris]
MSRGRTLIVTDRPSPDLAITGVTGSVGGLVAGALAGSGLGLRLLARNPAKAPALPGSVVRESSYDDFDRSVAALTGTRTLLMVSAAESSTRIDDHRTFVDAAATAGVRHIVYTSFLGASPDAVFTLARDHYRTEEHIRSSGMDHTFLRDALYLDFMTALVGEDGVVRGPAGDGRTAAVSRADVARSAVAVLRDPSAHRGRTYQLTGPESLTMSEIAEIIGRSRGSEVVFHNETVSEAYLSRRRWRAPEWQNDAWVSTYTAIAAGEMDLASKDVEMLTGIRPISLAEFLARTSGPARSPDVGMPDRLGHGPEQTRACTEGSGHDRELG